MRMVRWIILGDMTKDEGVRGKVGVTSAVDKKMVQACEEKVCRWDNKERYWL